MDHLAFFRRIGSEKLRLYPLGQPDAIDGSVKDMALPMHVAAVDAKNDRPSMTAADVFRRRHIAREVDVEPRLRHQSFSFDSGGVLFPRPMVKDFRRRHDGKFDVDSNGMALIGPYLGLIVVERIALFVVRPDDFLQDLSVEGIFFPDALYEFFHIGPAVLVKIDAGHPGFMPQNEADKAAGLGQIHGIHSFPYS